MACKISTNVKFNNSLQRENLVIGILIQQKKIATGKTCCYRPSTLRNYGYRTMSFLEPTKAISKHPDKYHTAVRTAELK
jgi:hypothetical protein